MEESHFSPLFQDVTDIKMEIKRKENVKILVVEDEYITYYAIKAVLERNGFSVLSAASSGEDAILKMKESSPDLVLMDIWLAGDMDGIEAAGKIHEFSTVPIIYLTALADRNSIERAKVSEPYGYIIKPCDENTLSTTIEMALFKHNIDELMRREKETSTKLAELSRALLEIPSMEEASRLVLEQAQSLSGSKIGCAGYLDAETGHLLCPAVTDDAADQCRVENTFAVLKKSPALWTGVRENKKNLVSNSPLDIPELSAMPGGHIPIHNFIVTPALISADVVGIIFVANKKENYEEKDTIVLQRLATLYALAFQKRLIQEELDLYRQDLEKLVVERTRELEDAVDRLKMEIAQREKAEKELEESRTNYQNLFENSPVGIFKVAVDGGILMANSSFINILGYSSREEISRLKLENTWFSANGSHRTFKQRMEQDGEVNGSEDRWTTKDNRVIFVRKNVRAVKDEEGNVLYYEGTVEDITGKKEAEEKAKRQEQQLIQADKMIALGTLVSGVAHEINNPNNFIMMNAPLLLELWQEICPILERYYETSGDFSIKGFNYSELKGAVPDLFAGIINGTKRIKNIVTELKNFSRRESDDIDQNVDINGVVKAAVKLTATMIEKSTRHFAVRYGKNIPRFKGNFQRLEQVVVNLIQNSCEALPDKDKGISISTDFDEGTGLLTVNAADEGTGIDPQNLKFIMDPFFTTRRDRGGTGLGLSIASTIVNRHGGSLSFDSQPGKGTTAVITIPVKEVRK
jgi:PAS domain S-box-containing protein